MGRKEESVQLPNLEVKVPAFFRCPISLDVMRSPVSLCTGVTYDRASIQQWLDFGNKTCPATMQSLPSTDFVPNLTLRRLINLWSATAASNAAAPTARRPPAANILGDLSTSCDPIPLLSGLADFFIDADNHESEKNELVGGGGCAAIVNSVLVRNVGRIDILEAAARVLALILGADWIEESNRRMAASSLIADLNASVPALISLLKEGKTMESRVESARVLGAVLSSSDQESKASIADKSDLIPELIRLIGEEKMDRSAMDAGLECLDAIFGIRRARLRMVREGIVPAAVKVLMAEASVAPASTAEKALRLLEGASGIAEGRSAICQASEECLGAVLHRMMKVGREGMEAAMTVLWNVCQRFQDRRAMEAVTADAGGMTKILLLMQSNCSPAVRQMSGDLLKIFRVNSKSSLAAYDTKTTHIMPF
ncbi:U-box domain-containing protein 27 [Platanthera guangdongensis]|uniref:U-box domain-containing protein n=1 Tax=Platanthera guangdongensis TaxID=2320717 RepID=A0ABR2LRN4_9ASPA